MAGEIVEDPGIPVDEIADDIAKLEEKASLEAGEDLILDSDWAPVTKLEYSPIVRAVLLQRDPPPGGAARIEGISPRYTPTDKVTGIVLVAAKPGEKLVLLGYPNVRRFRRR